MAELIITEKSDLVAVANAVRAKTGKTEELTLGEIISGINGIEVQTDPVLQDKTVTPNTNSQTITADSGYDGLDTVTVNAMPTATQATPSITVNSSGLITATATQTAGYVSAGTKSATKQLAFQAAKTITPTTASQIAVSSGYYTGGNVTVAGDSNLVAGNIKSGVSIFGVAGSYEGSGGDTDVEDSFVTGTVSSNYTNDRVTTVGSYAFYCNSYLNSVSFAKVISVHASAFFQCANLKTAYFPAATSISNMAFQGCWSLASISFPEVIGMQFSAFAYCYSLTSISFPKAKNVPQTCFYYCSNLTTINFPAASYIANGAFSNCVQLSTASFPACRSIYSYAFYRCYNLKALYLTSSSICILSNSNAFSSTPIGGYSTSAGTYGSIYVPASLLASYKAATNWVYFSSRFVGI